MEPIYRSTFPISDIYLDGFGRLKPSSILYFVQEAAGQHCNLLKVDWDTLAKQNLFWAVTRHPRCYGLPHHPQRAGASCHRYAGTLYALRR